MISARSWQQRSGAMGDRQPCTAGRHRDRRHPRAASRPLPPAQGSAHARRLPHQHPAHPLSSAGWFVPCTGSPGTAGRPASAAPLAPVVRDPPACAVPPRLACSAQRPAATAAEQPDTPCSSTSPGSTFMSLDRAAGRALARLAPCRRRHRLPPGWGWPACHGGHVQPLPLLPIPTSPPNRCMSGRPGPQAAAGALRLPMGRASRRPRPDQTSAFPTSFTYEK